MSSGGDLEVESAGFFAVDVSWVGILCVDSSDPIDDGRLGNDAIVNCSRTVLELFCLSFRN